MTSRRLAEDDLIVGLETFRRKDRVADITCDNLSSGCDE